MERKRTIILQVTDNQYTYNNTLFAGSNPVLSATP